MTKDTICVSYQQFDIHKDSMIINLAWVLLSPQDLFRKVLR
jgi:hypothetical protein